MTGGASVGVVLVVDAEADSLGHAHVVHKEETALTSEAVGTDLVGTVGDDCGGNTHVVLKVEVDEALNAHVLIGGVSGTVSDVLSNASVG